MEGFDGGGVGVCPGRLEGAGWVAQPSGVRFRNQAEHHAAAGVVRVQHPRRARLLPGGEGARDEPGRRPVQQRPGRPVRGSVRGRERQADRRQGARAGHLHGAPGARPGVRRHHLQAEIRSPRREPPRPPPPHRPCRDFVAEPQLRRRPGDAPGRRRGDAHQPQRRHVRRDGVPRDERHVDPVPPRGEPRSARQRLQLWRLCADDG
mmetsp:Transcript_122/g.360  ORF Transcript_122/g.360 Transcript_122/m.360 type:complete len:206 (-) Transcript_122:131-748(-)